MVDFGWSWIESGGSVLPIHRDEARGGSDSEGVESTNDGIVLFEI